MSYGTQLWVTKTSRNRSNTWKTGQRLHGGQKLNESRGRVRGCAIKRRWCCSQQLHSWHCDCQEVGKPRTISTPTIIVVIIEKSKQCCLANGACVCFQTKGNGIRARAVLFELINKRKEYIWPNVYCIKFRHFVNLRNYCNNKKLSYSLN